MGKRKRTNGCLLSILKMAVISSFVLLMSFFGLYLITTNIIEPIQAGINHKIQEVASIKDIEDIREQLVDQVGEESPTAMKSDQQSDEKEKSKADATEEAFNTEAEPQLSVQSQVEDIENEIALGDTERESAPIESRTEPVQKETTPVVEAVEEQPLPQEILEEIVDEQSKEKVDIPVYSRYELTLSDHMIQEAQGIYDEGEVNVGQLVGQYFSNMSVKERLSLMNMLLSKLKHIDISYVWGMVADGITEEEAAELQSLIEDNFTEQEIDELYTYYVKSELAQLE